MNFNNSNLLLTQNKWNNNYLDNCQNILFDNHLYKMYYNRIYMSHHILYSKMPYTYLSNY